MGQASNGLFSNALTIINADIKFFVIASLSFKFLTCECLLMLIEMKPRWFSLDNIPYNEMWPDDKHWLPLLLIDQKFYGYFLYDNEEYIIDKRIKIMDKYMM